MSTPLRLLAAFLAATLPLPAGAAEQPPSRPQYVLISFDGALDVAQWERSRQLAGRTGASFTYFLSCVYLLTRDTRETYQAPGLARGRSNVGYGYAREDVELRLNQIWAARHEGHEIASHGCGHFDGGDWTADEWIAEFDAFSTILRDAWTLNGITGEPAGWRDFAAGEIEGFRAPYLSTGSGLFEALARDGFRYDASTVSREPAAPAAVDEGPIRFALPMIPEGPAQRPVLAMDYNLFVRHSGGLERGDADGSFEQRALEAFDAALEAQIAGARVPLQLGFHFTLMNDGAYWRALERFAVAACARPEVRCVSYRAFLDAVAADGTASIATD